MGRIMLAVCGLLTVHSAAAANRPTCDRRDEVLRHLEGAYSETPVAIGLASNGGIVEVLTDGTGSTWTIIVTMPSGMSCLVAAGEDWEAVRRVAVGAKV